MQVGPLNRRGKKKSLAFYLCTLPSRDRAGRLEDASVTSPRCRPSRPAGEVAQPGRGAGGDARCSFRKGALALQESSTVQGGKRAAARPRQSGPGSQMPRHSLGSAPRGAWRRRRGADSWQAVSFSLVFPEPTQKGAKLNCEQLAPLCSWLRCQVPTVCWA